jgi:hypothetical protein
MDPVFSDVVGKKAESRLVLKRGYHQKYEYGTIQSAIMADAMTGALSN